MMLDTLPPTLPVRYAIPASRLPALSAKYGAPCVGSRPVRMETGIGYRLVLCGELSNPPIVLRVNPYTGRITVSVIEA